MNPECLCGTNCRRGEVLLALARYDERYRRRLAEILHTDLWGSDYLTGPSRMVSL